MLAYTVPSEESGMMCRKSKDPVKSVRKLGSGPPKPHMSNC